MYFKREIQLDCACDVYFILQTPQWQGILSMLIETYSLGQVLKMLCKWVTLHTSCFCELILTTHTSAL